MYIKREKVYCDSQRVKVTRCKDKVINKRKQIYTEIANIYTCDTSQLKEKFLINIKLDTIHSHHTTRNNP
jgi:hypothetical protein